MGAVCDGERGDSSKYVFVQSQWGLQGWVASGIIYMSMKGGIYGKKLTICKQISGIEFGRWRWCYFGHAGSRKYAVPIMNK